LPELIELTEGRLKAKGERSKAYGVTCLKAGRPENLKAKESF